MTPRYVPDCLRGTKVAEAKNTLPISDDNAAHIMLWPVLQHFIHMTSIMDRDKESLRRRFLHNHV